MGTLGTPVWNFRIVMPPAASLWTTMQTESGLPVLRYDASSAEARCFRKQQETKDVDYRLDCSGAASLLVCEPF